MLSDDSYSAFRAYIPVLLECRAKSEHLDLLGAARGTVATSSYTKVYKCKKKRNDDICKNNGFSIKRYTNLYIMLDGSKEYVPKKNTPLATVVRLSRIRMRNEITHFTKIYRKAAKSSCDMYNATRPRRAPHIDLDSLLEQEYEAFKGTAQYAEAIARVDSELARGSADALTGKGNFAKENSYINEIYLNPHERYRSKNELIAACALKSSGISYEVEPPYPGVSRCRADFGITVSERKIYVEIAGMMNEDKYRRDLLEKRRLAKLNGLPFVIIDMTDYSDESGKSRTKLNFVMLKRIFLDISLGNIKCDGEIIKPYPAAPPAAVRRTPADI